MSEVELEGYGCKMSQVQLKGVGVKCQGWSHRAGEINARVESNCMGVNCQR